MVIRLKYFINYNIIHKRRKANKCMLYDSLYIHNIYIILVEHGLLVVTYNLQVL